MPKPLHPIEGEQRGLRGNVAAPGSFRADRPLDFVTSLKGKLGIVIVATVLGSIWVLAIGRWLGFPLLPRLVSTAIIGLAVAHFLARGMISPLREMANAATAMARGDYSRRVRATSSDEVGDLARAFNAMAAELDQVERMRRDLVANVSHELRTPIGALRILLENLVDGIEPTDPQALETALAQTERLGRLVEQLLDLSKLESGGLPMRREPFAIGAMLDQVARECTLTQDDPQTGRGVRVDWSAEPADLLVSGDAERLHQVVKNLLDNAVRHSPAGGVVRVTASTTGASGNGSAHRTNGHGHVQIEVVDEGPGIAPEDADRVFERFYRTDRARSAHDGGTGLGLAIARWIVDAHDGTIHATQAQPRGCRMVIHLPR
ncbi:MAG: HAMP domain-containing protein [Solirubrobacteraceae bacterium]|nr:HAMP domain-containing protein [Solirubrobacteraceae bacterium]